MPVVDASVFVSIHHAGDRFHKRCAAWLEKALERGDSLTAPNLLAIESAASLRRLTGEESLAAEAVEELIEGGWIRLFPLTRDRALAAAALAGATGVRGADAVYLALARELDEPLITLDRLQLERGRNAAIVQRP